jgi:hypothetical protein
MVIGLRTLMLALVLCLSTVACVGLPYDEESGVALQESPLGGEALIQRKHDLDRALQDMQHFQVTISTLVDRHDAGSMALLDDFLARYLSRHLDSLLRPEWQSSNNELAAVDASLRFAKAELLIRMRYPRLVQESIDDIERRYDGRDSMLIAYPLDRQSTLGEGLEILKDRKWKG